MKPAIVAAVEANRSKFLPIPESVAKIANVRDADLFDVKLTPDGVIEFRRVEEGDKA